MNTTLPCAIPKITDAKGRTFNRAPDGCIVHNDLGYKNFIDVNPWLRICKSNIAEEFAIFTFQDNGTWKFESEYCGTIENAIDAAEEIIAEEEKRIGKMQICGVCKDSVEKTYSSAAYPFRPGACKPCYVRIKAKLREEYEEAKKLKLEKKKKKKKQIDEPTHQFH